MSEVRHSLDELADVRSRIVRLVPANSRDVPPTGLVEFDAVHQN